MPNGTQEREAFVTSSLVEAALMFMRTGSVKCTWTDVRMCEFEFLSTPEDVQFARNAKTTVVARDFNHALVQVKSAMYGSKDG